MRKKITTLLLSLVLVFATGCSKYKETTEEAAETTEESEDVTEVSETSDESEEVEEAIETVDTSIELDYWEIKSFGNDIPITPEGYQGQVADYITEYTDTTGKTIEKVYKNVAFVNDDDKTDYGQRYTHSTSVEIDGETVFGKFLLQTETLSFLTHVTGTDNNPITEYFYLDIDASGYVLELNDENVLIADGTTIYTYSFETQNCKIITTEALDYKYPVGETLFYISWDHEELACDWNNNHESKKTGEKVISYWDEKFNAEINSEFQKFTEIQSALKEGAASRDTFEEEYDIYYGGDIYSVATKEYLGNVHLPNPLKWNRNCMYDEYESCYLTEKNSLTLYRYGEVVREYQLPEGEWKVIKSYLDIHEDANSSSVNYIVDTNDDDIITAEELNAAIVNTNILLMNAAEKAVYTINQNGMVTKVAQDVQDYCDAYGMFYWMDSEYNAYELSWTESTESVLIGQDVVGISKYTDERAGFIVKPDDPRCNTTSDGFSLCTLYGDDWLNQKDTSGSWALDHREE